MTDRFSVYLPNGTKLMSGLMLSRERLNTGAKMAIPIPLLKSVLSIAIGALPFDERFYLSTYPDIRNALSAGLIDDPRAHFVEEGYFEGRLGALPDFDEAFYKATYPDVAAAIEKGDVGSAVDHYVGVGAAEGRSASRVDMEASRRWMFHLETTIERRPTRFKRRG
jgi:hypothetical protein